MEASELSDIDFLLVFEKELNSKPDKNNSKDYISEIIKNYFSDKGFTKISCFSCLDLNELTHNIGGLEDKNRNLTSRILLILESIPIYNEN